MSTKTHLLCGCLVSRDERGREILIKPCAPCDSFASECHDESVRERNEARERAWDSVAS